MREVVVSRFEASAKAAPPALRDPYARGAAHRVPGMDHVLRRAEIGLAAVRGVRELGGFLAAVAQKH